MSITHSETAAVIDLTDWNAAHVGQEFIYPKATGRYFANMTFGNSGTGSTQDRVSYVGLWLPAGTLDRLGVWITTGGAAGSVVRMGLYGTTNGIPGTLVVDGGTVATTVAAGTGFKEVSISQVITAGLYWIAAVPQVAAPDWVHTGSAPQITVSQVTVDNSNYGGYGQAGVSGALPGTATPVDQGFGGNNPRVWFRYSA